MKRRWIWLLLTLLCLLLTGCAAGSADWADLQDSWTAGSVANADEAAWSYSLWSREVYQETRAPEDLQVLATGRYALPRMTAYHADGTEYDLAAESDSQAVRVVQRFEGYFDNWLEAQQTNFAEISAMAQDVYTQKAEGESWYCYTDQVETTFWNNDHIACVTLWRTSYTGGAHSIRVRTAVTMDMRTGREVTINDMVSNYGGLQDAVTDYILEQINSPQWLLQNSSDMLFKDYAQTVPEWMSRSVFFSDGQMTVVFGVYDLAPYTAGEQAFTIPYSVIEPYLNDYGREVLEIA